MFKKLTIVLLTLVFVVSLSARLMQEYGAREPINHEFEFNHIIEAELRNEIPEWEFHYLPQFIGANYYDYFPGGYEAIPLRVQPNGDGLYFAFQSRPEAGAVRRVFYAYITNGEVQTTSIIDFENTLIEGFPGIDIDPDTSNPFVSWHVPGPENELIYALGFTFDEYNLLGMPGLWNSVYHPVDNIDYPHSLIPELSDLDEFIWPSVIVGPSPQEGMKRLYILSRNFASNAAGVPCENTLIAWVDYSHHSEISTFNASDWSYATVPQMDTWRENSVRSFRANIINSDGNLVIIGSNSDLDDDAPPISPEEVFFVLEAVDLDNGVWDLHTTSASFDVENPLDPDTHQGFFEGSDGPYEYLRYSPSSSRHTATMDANGNIHYFSNFTLGTEENTWFPGYTTMKHVKFDSQTNEFSFQEIFPNFGETEMHIPWVVDEDGYIDLDQGVTWSYPVYWYAPGEFFHENYSRMVAKGNWMIALHQDGTKAYRYHEINDEDYAAYANVPETLIYVSNDNGETWKAPIVMNSIITPELSGMIPAYFYIGDDIEIINDTWGRVHIVFFDQTDYGSSIQGASPVTGGDMLYAALDIEFGPLSTGHELPVDLAQGSLRQNFPNPFNPETNIAFNMLTEGRAKIEVFNVKGQLVKTIADRDFAAGEHSVVWNGTDNSNSGVASGVYFYRLTTDTSSEMKKMLLLK